MLLSLVAIVRRKSLVLLFFSSLALLGSLSGCSSQTQEESAPRSVHQTGDSDAAGPTKMDTVYPLVKVETTSGSMVFKLDREQAPATVSNFLDYVNEGFYSGTTFHFVDPGKMILGGGFDTTGQMKPTRLSIRNEATNGLKNTRGTIAMARSMEQIDSSTTQFFVNLIDSPEFDYEGDTPEKHGYCVFGEVVEGLDVAEKISRVPVKQESSNANLVQAPESAVVINAMSVVR